MSKVVGKNSEANAPESTGSVNVVTKEYLANFGKTIADTMTAGFEALKK